MPLFFVALGLLFPLVSHAHIKWFSSYGFEQAPLSLSAVFASPYFWPLFALSLLSLPAIVFLDRLAENSKAYRKFNLFLDRYASNSHLIMRVAMAAVLLMSWQADSIIAPEIAIPSPIWGWVELLLAVLLLFRETSHISGLGILIFYAMGITNHGLFHMLDYVVYPAVGLFFVLSHFKNERVRNLRLPVLYSGLGFSLCWVAFEKLIYPYWGISVLEQAPALTMGFAKDFFLEGAAFVEFTLGYLLIICLLQRPLAVVITVVFIITTSFFGKTEVMGHTMLHGALLVFIVAGPGHYYQAPIKFHRSPFMRSLFAIVNFVLLFFAMAYPYQKMASDVHARMVAQRNAAVPDGIAAPADARSPQAEITAIQDKHGGWNVYVKTNDFRFSPEHAGLAHRFGEGHAHVYVNGEKQMRLYGSWFHLNLPKGKSWLKVGLYSNDHRPYVKDGRPVAPEIEILETRESAAATHAH
jgi:hypothetical protein